MMSLGKSDEFFFGLFIVEIKRKFSLKTVSELFTLAEQNESYINEIRNVLKLRFAEKIVIFEDPIEECDMIEETNQMIIMRFYNNSFSEWVIKEFGHLIKTLYINIDNDIDDYLVPQSSVNYANIGKYLSETLTELHLINLNDDFFKHIEKPFKNVKILSLYGLIQDIGNHKLNFSEMFPALRHLHVSKDATVIDEEYLYGINLEFPHLKFLDIEINNADIGEYNDLYFSTESMALELIKKNRQIQNLVLKNTSKEFIKNMMKEIPKLTQLQKIRIGMQKPDKETMEKTTAELLEIFGKGSSFNGNETDIFLWK